MNLGWGWGGKLVDDGYSYMLATGKEVNYYS